MINKILLSRDQAIALENYKCLESLKQISFDDARQKQRYVLFHSLCLDKAISVSPAMLAFISLVLCNTVQELYAYAPLVDQIAHDLNKTKLNMFDFENYLQVLNEE